MFALLTLSQNFGRLMMFSFLWSGGRSDRHGSAKPFMAVQLRPGPQVSFRIKFYKLPSFSQCNVLHFEHMVNLKIIQPANLWYIVGLIVTDGNLSKDGRHVSITSKDAELLIEVKIALHLESKLGHKARGGEKEKKYTVLQFSDVAFYQYLNTIGIQPKKSLTLGAINVPSDYFKDFLRGVIDGDGSINTWIHKTNKQSQWCLRITSGAPLFSTWIHQEIQNHFSVTGKLYSYKFKGKKNPINIIKFGKIATKIILRNIYYSNCLSLERKRITAQQCLNDKDGWKGYAKMINNAEVVER